MYKDHKNDFFWESNINFYMNHITYDVHFIWLCIKLST